MEALEIMPDHVDLFVSFDPRYAVAEIVNRLKGVTRRNMRAEFGELREFRRLGREVTTRAPWGR